MEKLVRRSARSGSSIVLGRGLPLNQPRRTLEASHEAIGEKLYGRLRKVDQSNPIKYTVAESAALRKG